LRYNKNVERKPRRRWPRRLAIAAGGILILLVVDYWLYPLWAPIAGESHDKGLNGLWLRYTWYFGQERDFPELAERFKREGIRYAYFHVRFIKRDGALNFRYRQSAQRLNREFERLAPDTMRLAWIYVGNQKGGGSVDPMDAVPRKKMIQEAKWLIDEAGFDAIQWDYEICPNGDKFLLDLLDETREALPGVYISTCVPSAYSPPLRAVSWTPEYFRQVAERSDQLTVMCYDTGLYLPRLYVRHLQNCVSIIGQATKGAKCTIQLGLPTYEDGPRAHNPRAENIEMGLKGARESDWPANFEGVSLFADYTTEPKEWDLYHKLWRK
jgi:hypothetical protein